MCTLMATVARLVRCFSVDVRKIDREFIRDLPHEKDDAAIVHSIIAMADELGLDVVAEGVETEQQFEFLREAYCGISQGTIWAQPIKKDLRSDLGDEEGEKRGWTQIAL